MPYNRAGTEPCLAGQTTSHCGAVDAERSGRNLAIPGPLPRDPLSLGMDRRVGVVHPSAGRRPRSSSRSMSVCLLWQMGLLNHAD